MEKMAFKEEGAEQEDLFPLTLLTIVSVETFKPMEAMAIEVAQALEEEFDFGTTIGKIKTLQVLRKIATYKLQ